MKIKYLVKCKCFYDGYFIDRIFYLGQNNKIKFFDTESDAIGSIIEHINTTQYELILEIKKVYVIPKRR